MELESKEVEKSDISLNVVDVTKDNFIAMWPTILFAVKTSTLIALDLVGKPFHSDTEYSRIRFKILFLVRNRHFHKGGWL